MLMHIPDSVETSFTIFSHATPAVLLQLSQFIPCTVIISNFAFNNMYCGSRTAKCK